MNLFFEEKGNDIILRVRLTPNSSSCVVRGIFTDASGDCFLKINVVSVPEKGKANQELINLLAKRLKLAKADFKIISGETDRYKKIAINNLSIINKLQEMAEELREELR